MAQFSMDRSRIGIQDRQHVCASGRHLKLLSHLLSVTPAQFLQHLDKNTKRNRSPLVAGQRTALSNYICGLMFRLLFTCMSGEYAS